MSKNGNLAENLSGILDELLGRLIQELGIVRFTEIFQLKGMVPLVRSIANSVVEQRIGSYQSS